MKRLSLFLALGIASSSAVAAADPYPSRADRSDRADRGGDRYNGRPHTRYDEKRWGRDFRGRWVTLAREYSARTDRQFISVSGQGGRFDHLILRADRGTPVITKVVIEYLNNPNAQAVTLDTRIPTGESEMIRLNGSQRINRIIVYSEPRYGGSYSIFGT